MGHPYPLSNSFTKCSSTNFLVQKLVLQGSKTFLWLNIFFYGGQIFNKERNTSERKEYGKWASKLCMSVPCLPILT